MIFVGSAMGQPPALKIPALDEGVWFNFSDSGQIDRDKQELSLLREENSELKGANATLTKEKELAQKEADLNKQLADIAEKKSEASDQAFKQMKEISDKWQELAKEKKKTFNITQILGGIIAGLVSGILLHGL
jgi:hypothetical protein